LELQLTIYGIFGVFWWQIVKSMGAIKSNPFDAQDLDFWIDGNPRIVRLALINIKILWPVIFLFPIYFGYKYSFWNGFLVFIVMNIGAVFTGNLSRSLGLPVKQLLTVASVVCPILTAILIYTLV
jgi:hypothetical protein